MSPDAAPLRNPPADPVAALAGALEKYGAHLATCSCDPTRIGYLNRPCDCGLRVALDAAGFAVVSKDCEDGRAAAALRVGYQDGYRAVATVSIVGPRAAQKAVRTADALIAIAG